MFSIIIVSRRQCNHRWILFAGVDKDTSVMKRWIKFPSSGQWGFFVVLLLFIHTYQVYTAGRILLVSLIQATSLNN